ncbi:hypothetical protein SARC_10957 [Sphaeroforma arctica JP610]|uniref:UBA domain-containing protein n=1 Tax=Sphaeroforma arctica JP610 TaxID=667725 RepID=A0A0L0FIE6_9EUKA|nr:hypothetical protein SARC_10957 [Sphaeroforma arctica JP610]KNC76544.1 hypothetical protein SARC_10957 [Sphaeroforma arctica JP610]|eukprot:XP_014150446.1 hypothetical protein SARC_10957 [Sphaeroforma arctica JP610]
MADTDAKSLSELMELTGLDIVAARSLLHAFNGDTNAAMNDFLENGVGSKPSEFMETDSPDHAQAHAQTSTVEHSDTDDEDPRRDTHTQTTTRTTTTASSSGDGRVYETAPQQEAKQSSSHVGGSGSSDEEFDTTHIGRRIRTRKRSYNPAENDGVRAPDQQYRERLLDPHASMCL